LAEDERRKPQQPLLPIPSRSNIAQTIPPATQAIL